MSDRMVETMSTAKVNFAVTVKATMSAVDRPVPHPRPIGLIATNHHTNLGNARHGPWLRPSICKTSLG